MKTCSKCKLLKDENDFYKHSTHKDGLTSHCKECIRERHKKYRESHKEEIVAKQKKWRKTMEGKEARAIEHKTYYQTHKEAYYKHVAKRRRELQWIPLHDNIFPPDVEVHWHHINSVHVVALPKDLHIACYRGTNKAKHLLAALQVYEQFYDNGEWEHRN